MPFPSRNRSDMTPPLRSQQSEVSDIQDRFYDNDDEHSDSIGDEGIEAIFETVVSRRSERSSPTPDEIMKDLAHTPMAYKPQSDESDSSATFPLTPLTGSPESSSHLRDDFPRQCSYNKCFTLQRDLEGKQPFDEESALRIVDHLHGLGIRVYVIPSYSDKGLLWDIRKVLKEESNHRNKVMDSDQDKECCLLYKNISNGRLYNITLKGHAVAGLVGTFQSLRHSFSGFQAMAALVVISRSLACAADDEAIGVKPAYLSLILGLVLTEEISLSLANAVMYVRGYPSISAFALTTHLPSDWLRKVMILMLALAGAANGKLQVYLTLGGILLACFILLANLGSRAWNTLDWNSFSYSGIGASPAAYALAIVTGICFPYMGHRDVLQSSGHAIVIIIQNSILVAIIFVLSAFEEVQKFLVVGSETCDQDVVNSVIGIWWTVTVLVCLGLVYRLHIQPTIPSPEEEESTLEVNESSPVGYTVPSLPHFAVDPGLCYHQKAHESGWISTPMKVVGGGLVTCVIGTLIVYMSFTQVDDEFTSLETDWF